MRAVPREVVGPWAGVWPFAIGIWLACGVVLAVVATHVRDWLVMTDELLYERLAISVDRTGSPLHALHGVHISSLDQLYPLVIAPAFAAGTVPHDLAAAHIIGAS